MSATPKPSSTICGFYHQKTVFVTGASGFVGKSLVQRLLVTCKDIANIYVLLRGKRGATFEERLAEYRQDEVFSYLDNKDALMSKVVAVEGDIRFSRLGLSDQDFQTLTSKVGVVFHAAASVRYNEDLRTATTLHIFGTNQVLELCRRMAKFQVLVHVSSISAWFNRDFVGEIIYPSFLDPLSLMSEISSISDEEVTKLSQRYIGRPPKFANAYVLTKTLAEVLINESAKDLTTAVVRLPFMVGAMKDPCPGWCDKLQTHNAMIVAVASGMLRTMALDHSAMVDFLPVDVCSNALIVAAWDTFNVNSNLKVYNVSADENEVLTLGETWMVAADIGRRWPSSKQILPPAIKIPVMFPNRFEVKFKYFSMKIFSRLIDVVMRLSGKPPVIAKYVYKMIKGVEEISDGLGKSLVKKEIGNIWCLFRGDGLIELEERQLFYCDPRLVNWREVHGQMYMRFRRKTLKEPDTNCDHARRRMSSINSAFEKFIKGLKVAGGAAILILIAHYFKLRKLIWLLNSYGLLGFKHSLGVS